MGGDDQGFLKEGVKTYQMAPTLPVNSQTFLFVFTSIVYQEEKKTNLDFGDQVRQRTPKKPVVVDDVRFDDGEDGRALFRGVEDKDQDAHV